MLQGKLVALWRYVRTDKTKAYKWAKAIPTAVFLACLGLLGYKAYSSWETLLQYKWEIRYVWLLPSLLLFLAQTLIIVWGWWSIVDRLAAPVPFRKHVKIYCYTSLARRIPASLLWLVAGRAYWYRQLDIPVSASAAASLLELELIILTGLPIGALQIGAVTSLSPGLVALLSGLAVAVVAVTIRPNILNQFSRLFRRQIPHLNVSHQRSLGWVVIYTAVWLLSGAGLYAAVNLFYDLPLRTLPEIIGVWTLASLVSYFTLLTPSGFGVKELSLTFLLAFYLPEPLPLVVALAMRGLWTVYDIIAGLASIRL